jgi:hypothetical protein
LRRNRTRQLRRNAALRFRLEVSTALEKSARLEVGFRAKVVDQLAGALFQQGFPEGGRQLADKLGRLQRVVRTLRAFVSARLGLEDDPGLDDADGFRVLGALVDPGMDFGFHLFHLDRQFRTPRRVAGSGLGFTCRRGLGAVKLPAAL